MSRTVVNPSVLKTPDSARAQGIEPEVVLPRIASAQTLELPATIRSSETARAIRQSDSERSVLASGMERLTELVTEGNYRAARRILTAVARLDLTSADRTNLNQAVQKFPESERPISLLGDVVQRVNSSFKSDLWQLGVRSASELSRIEFARFVADKARVTFADTRTPHNTDGGSVFKAVCDAGFSRALQTDILVAVLRSRTALFRHAAETGDNLADEKFSPDLHATVTAAGRLAYLPGKKAIAALVEFLTEAPSGGGFLLTSAKVRAVGSLQEMASSAVQQKEPGILRHLRENRPDLEALTQRFRASGEGSLENETSRLLTILST